MKYFDEQYRNELESASIAQHRGDSFGLFSKALIVAHEIIENLSKKLSEEKKKSTELVKALWQVNDRINKIGCKHCRDVAVVVCAALTKYPGEKNLREELKAFAAMREK